MAFRKQHQVAIKVTKDEKKDISEWAEHEARVCDSTPAEQIRLEVHEAIQEKRYNYVGDSSIKRTSRMVILCDEWEFKRYTKAAKRIDRSVNYFIREILLHKVNKTQDEFLPLPAERDTDKDKKQRN